MKDTILENIDNPAQLEKLFRSDKSGFEQAINSLYTNQQKTPALEFWRARLLYKEASISLYSKKEFGWMVVFVLMAGLIANIGNIKGINSELFFSRNTSFIIIPFVAAYFLWKQNAKKNTKLIVVALFGISALFINLLPNITISSSIELTYLHLPIFLWAILGYAFIGGDLKNNHKAIAFLKFNGNFVIMTGLIFISGMFFTGITIALFELLKIDIKDFYFEQIAVWGLAAIPMLSTFLVQNNPELVNKISPTIARIFTPIIFVTLLVFLITLIYTGVNIYNDRNFLLLFNILLIGVMAIILFSLSELTNNTGSKINLIILLGLAILTIIANAIALSAISFRLSEFGLSPNRLAVLGANLLMFAHLLFVSYGLIKNLNGKGTLQDVEAKIASFIPIYALWAAFISFLLPFIFQFS